ncbi:MAG: hypothetical protein ABEJ87_03465 [Candidatus Nanohalobium sp.]
MKEDFQITSSFEQLQVFEASGRRLSVGFRPSGELHVGNLLTLAYSSVIASRLGLELDLFCCDTDWSAHIHENHRPENSDVMRLFFERDCPCNEHGNVAEHRVEEIRPFLDGLENFTGEEVEADFLSELDSEGYREALSSVLENMDEFDEIFGGGFRRRYRSPVVNVCDNCGFSHAKGAPYSSESGELVASCRNKACGEGFSRGQLDGKIGVYYLVDPVRDPSRDVSVHVFGGDYRDAAKEQKTSKIVKVAKITKLATGETPAYFLAPMIADEEGKPLSKSKGTGLTVSEIDDLEEYGERLAEKVEELLDEERKHVQQQEILF